MDPTTVLACIDTLLESGDVDSARSLIRKYQADAEAKTELRRAAGRTRTRRWRGKNGDARDASQASQASHTPSPSSPPDGPPSSLPDGSPHTPLLYPPTIPPLSPPSPTPPAGPGQSAMVAEVWSHYRNSHPRCAPRLLSGTPDYRKVVAALKAGFTVKDCCEAIDGYHNDPWHCGTNDRGKKYLSFGLIFRDSDHIQNGIEMHNNPTPQGYSEKTIRSVSAARQWASDKTERSTP